MLNNMMSLLLLLPLAVSPAVVDLPRPDTNKETLAVAKHAVVAMLEAVSQPRCSVILFTDGNISAAFIRESVLPRAPWGVTVLEVIVNGQNARVLEEQFYQLVSGAVRLRQGSWCLTVVVVSDDPAFLATCTESSLKSLLLVWSTKLIVVTRLSLQELHHLQKPFSMTNTVLLTVEDNQRPIRCSAHVHFPYSPPDAQPLKVASWTPKRGLVTTSNNVLFPDKFYTLLHGPSLVVAAEVFEPHIALVKQDGAVSAIPDFEGPVVNLLQILMKSMNFTHTYVRPPDGAWGLKMDNGSWTGMVGMVYRKEADIGLGPFSMRIPRTEVADYTRPVMLDDHRVLARRGKPEVDPWSFLFPLTPIVWVAIVAAMLVLPAVVFLLSYTRLKSTTNADWPTNMMFSYIRVILQQDFSMSPDLLWERVVLGVWMMMTLVLTKSYAGNLMSLLAVRHTPQPYQSIQDVVDDPSVIMIWETNSGLVNYYRDSKSGVFKEVADAEKIGRIKFVKGYEYYSSMDIFVRRGDHAIFAESLYGEILRAQDFSRKGRCDFYGSREVFLPFMMGLIGLRGSPLVPSMSNRVKWVTQTGLYYHWVQNAMPNASFCATPPSRTAVSSSLALNNLWGMFVVLLGGLSISLLVLTLELLSALLLQTNSTPHLMNNSHL